MAPKENYANADSRRAPRPRGTRPPGPARTSAAATDGSSATPASMSRTHQASAYWLLVVVDRAASNAGRRPAEREDLDSELAPAGGAEPRRIGTLPPLAAALVAVLGGRAAATVAELRRLDQRVSERALTGIESSSRRSRSCSGERPSVVR